MGSPRSSVTDDDAEDYDYVDDDDDDDISTSDPSLDVSTSEPSLDVSSNSDPSLDVSTSKPSLDSSSIPPKEDLPMIVDNNEIDLPPQSPPDVVVSSTPPPQQQTPTEEPREVIPQQPMNTVAPDADLTINNHHYVLQNVVRPTAIVDGSDHFTKRRGSPDWE